MTLQDDKALDIPNIRFNNFDKAWQLTKLSDVLQLITRPIKMKDDNSYSLVTVKRRYEGIVSRGIYKGRDIKVKSQFLIKENDFLISKRQISHNACGIVPKELDGSIVSNEYTVFNPKLNLDIIYFNYFCNLRKVSQSFFLSSIGVHIEKMIFKVDDWLKRKFYFPSLPEQQKIASFLTAIDQKINQLSQKVALQEQYKKGVMQKIFSQELRFKDNDGNDFADWEVKKLGDILEAIIDNRGKTPPLEGNGIPLIEVNAIGKRNIDYANIKKYVSKDTFDNWFRKYLKKGDILFSTVGATALCSYYSNKEVSCIAQNIVGLRFLDTPYFYLYMIKEINNNRMFKRIEMGAVQPSIKVSQMTEIQFLIPSYQERIKIANFLSQLDEQIAQTQEQLAHLRDYKKGLLQQLFV